MRLRSWFTFGVGAVVGAGGLYLADPEHGRARRREVAMSLRDRAAAQGSAFAHDAAAQARAVLAEQGRLVLEQAREGFRASRSG